MAGAAPVYEVNEFMVSGETRKALDKFVRSVVFHRTAPSFSDELAKARELSHPPDAEGEYEVVTQRVMAPEWVQFRRILFVLRKENEAEHLSDDEIVQRVLGLLDQVEEDRGSCSNAKVRGAYIGAFLDVTMQPWREYEVVWPIDHMKLDGSTLKMGQVTFREFGGDLFEQWSLHGPDQAITDLRGKPVAMLVTRAGSHAAAGAKAEAEIDETLDLLRYGQAAVRPYETLDNALRYERGDPHLVRPTDAPGEIGEHHHLGIRAVAFPISTVRAAALTKALVDDLSTIDERIAPDFSYRIRRAMRSIGASAARTSFDDKIIELCTAFEALCTSEQEQLKGQVLAVRSMLLTLTVGEPLVDTVDLYRLYMRRSAIIHGSRAQPCTEWDYQLMRAMAVMFLRQVIRLVADRDDITTYDEFIAAITEQLALTQAIAWLKDRGADGKSMLKHAQTIRTSERSL